MHDEWRVAGECFVATAVRVRNEIGRLAAREIRHVVADPLALLFIPPDQRLALAPWLAIGPGRGAVVEDTAIERPRVSPAVRVASFRRAAVRSVLAVEYA